MRRLEADVVVIGGGSTGAGVVRDVAMRGFKAILVDRVDLAQGTSGRFHGLLHSGGRYVVSDPHSATECAEENEIVKRIQAEAIEPTGGFFVATPADDPAYGDQFKTGAEAAGVPVNEVSIAELLRREPRVNPKATRAFETLDGSVDGWKLVWGAAHSAEQYGAKILTYHRVTKIERTGDTVSAVICTDDKTGETVQIGCSFVVNCAAAWGGKVAAMADCHGVEVVPGAGIMIAMNHRLVNSPVNRLTYPADGDIIVPVHTVCIIGTTDQKADDPDNLEISPEEVQQMMECGEQLVPGFREARALHAWAGARPLVKDSRVSATDTRHMSRGMSIIDHSERDGLKGLLTIAGGKLTTYRLMAKNVVNAMCEQMGEQRECRTADEAIPGSQDHKFYAVNHRLHDREEDRLSNQIICECELLTKKMFTDLQDEQPLATFDDLRRQLRLGMGPCQGGFCSMRATGVSHDRGKIDIERATGLLRLFLKNRWIGLWPILNGDQARQTALDDWIFEGILDIGHLPQPAEEVER